jgi:YD repeat-containing protein
VIGFLFCKDKVSGWGTRAFTPYGFLYLLQTHSNSGSLDHLDSSHVHAVTNANSSTYSYDANGNMITRHVGTETFNFTYDAENRLVSVSGDKTASFAYRCNGKSRV